MWVTLVSCFCSMLPSMIEKPIPALTTHRPATTEPPGYPTRKCGNEESKHTATSGLDAVTGICASS